MHEEPERFYVITAVRSVMMTMMMKIDEEGRRRNEKLKFIHNRMQLETNDD